MIIKNSYNKYSQIFGKFNKFQFKRNFDQFKERPKRHFMVLYRYIEDMHYKRGISVIIYNIT
jgi:hypothetical protein